MINKKGMIYRKQINDSEFITRLVKDYNLVLHYNHTYGFIVPVHWGSSTGQFNYTNVFVEEDDLEDDVE
jgi:hypothetical protein